MKVSDIVTCKEILKPSGVMGSTLKKQKLFEGYAIITAINHVQAHVMLPSGKFMFLKHSFLEVVCASG